MASRRTLIAGAAALLTASLPASATAATPWTVSPSPNVGDTRFSNHLSGVAAVSSTRVYAVGEGGYRQPLIERWNGVKWGKVPLPTLSAHDSWFNGVAAIGPKDVWAAGGTQTSGPIRPLIFRYDGAHWSNFTTLPAGGAVLRISATSSTDVWVLTDESDQFGAETLRLQRWDGAIWHTAWTTSGTVVQRFPSADLVALGLKNVWVAYAREDNIYGPDTTFAGYSLHWNGVKARPTGGPDYTSDPPAQSTLAGVGASSASNVFEVGSASWGTGAGSTQAAIAARSDGSGWSNAFSTLHPGPDTFWFNAVAPASATDVWAVGNRTNLNANAQFNLLAHWDGLQWTELGGPNPATFRNTLSGVTAVPGGGFWAVGSSQVHDQAPRTMILRCCT